MSDVYAERGYASHSVGVGAKPGLVVVDFQRYGEHRIMRSPQR